VEGRARARKIASIYNCVAWQCLELGPIRCGSVTETGLSSSYIAWTELEEERSGLVLVYASSLFFSTQGVRPLSGVP